MAVLLGFFLLWGGLVSGFLFFSFRKTKRVGGLHMLQIQDVNFMKGCLETTNVDFSQLLELINPHVQQLPKYTKVFYLRCFMASDRF